VVEARPRQSQQRAQPRNAERVSRLGHQLKEAPADGAQDQGLQARHSIQAIAFGLSDRGQKRLRRIAALELEQTLEPVTAPGLGSLDQGGDIAHQHLWGIGQQCGLGRRGLEPVRTPVRVGVVAGARHPLLPMPQDPCMAREKLLRKWAGSGFRTAGGVPEGHRKGYLELGVTAIRQWDVVARPYAQQTLAVCFRRRKHAC